MQKGHAAADCFKEFCFRVKSQSQLSYNVKIQKLKRRDKDRKSVAYITLVGTDIGKYF